MNSHNKFDLCELRSSGLFDDSWYLEQYPDVKLLGMDALEHYLWVGAKIGRDPSAKFNTERYLSLHADVASAKVNPLVHYVRWGKKEGRALGLDQNRPAVRPRRPVKSDDGTIRQGPFAIRRHYRDFDVRGEAHFLNALDRLFRADKAAFDDVKISVVMPTFNRAETLGRAIESVLSQSHSNWELFIADDGSTDNSSEIVERFSRDSRIKYIKLDHVGVSGARNEGLRSATGEYVAYLDSDNSWSEQFLRSMLVFMRSQQLDAAYSGIRALDDDGNLVCHRGDVFIWSVCKFANYVDLNPFMHRRDAAFENGERIFFDTTLKRLVDWDFILRLTAECKISYAPFIGVNYYDGQQGNRITRTVYQNGEMPAIVQKIRAKHNQRGPAHNNLDTGAGTLFAGPLAIDKLDRSDTYSLRFYPDYTVSNAYQKLLYDQFEDFDIAAGTIDDCLGLALEERTHPDRKVVFHIHWLNPILGPAKDHSQAVKLVDEFLARARLFVALGGKLIWTVHNVVSHEPRFLDLEERLSQGIAELAHWVHVHHGSVIEATRGHYEIPPEKVLVAEHGNYIGTLPCETRRDQARSSFGIPDNHRVFLFLGQIRGYKGIDELVDAFADITRDRDDCWLILAGKVLGVSQADLEKRLSVVRNVIFRPGFVPDDEMQVYLRSADAMVLPYRKVLTSGSVFLALSFGLPVICPRAGLLSHIVEDGENGLTYEADDSKGLANSMARFLASDARSIRRLGANALRTAASYPWDETARKIRRHLEAGEFGKVVRTQLGDKAHSWFVHGDLGSLENKRCIAVVLHYQHPDDTRNCLKAIFDQDSDIGIVLISNAATLDDLRSIAAEFPQIVAVQSEDNVGYAAANNFGLWLCQQAGSEFFWIINPDIVVPAGYYENMIRRLEEWPEHDFFGTTIVAAHEPKKALFCGGEVRLDEGARPGHLHMGSSVGDLPSEPFECDYLTGANIFGRTRALKSAGYMPEDYFLYFEETHWFVQMGLDRHIRKPVVFPDLAIGNHKRSEVNSLPSKYYIYYFIRNSLNFGRHFVPEQRTVSEREARKFADAWLKKIGARAPGQLHDFELLVQRAFNDGRQGRTGRVDL